MDYKTSYKALLGRFGRIIVNSLLIRIQYISIRWYGAYAIFRKVHYGNLYIRQNKNRRLFRHSFLEIAVFRYLSLIAS